MIWPLLPRLSRQLLQAFASIMVMQGDNCCRQLGASVRGRSAGADLV